MDTSSIARRELRPPLRVGTILSEGERARFFGYASDLSETGMFVQSMRPREIGERVRLVLFAPGAPGGAVCVDAEVRWHRDYAGKNAHSAGIGVEFVNLGKVEQLYLRDFCTDPAGAIPTSHHVLD